jgi:thioredoxin 1
MGFTFAPFFILKFEIMKGNFSELIQSNTPVLVDFYADWCQPCRIQSPILQEIAREMDGKVRVIKINVDQNQEVSGKYQVQSIPTLMLFRKGEVKWRQAGVTPKVKIMSVIHQILRS